MELVSNWYMRDPDPKKRSMNIPRLYQKYVGHDNNRDSYANNQPETEAISRQQFIEWNPQIMYNQHQTGPAGTVLFMAPFRDPFNYNYDPLVPQGIELVGAAIHQRFITEGKPGAVMRGAASYSTWFNGGVRTTTGFHNQIGLLSEIIGNPTPISIPFLPQRLLPDGNQPFPIQPQQVWHQRQSIEYLLTADRAILDLASKDREGFLYRSYVMGRNSIARGSADTWTLTPKKIAAVQAAIAKEMGTPAARPGRRLRGRRRARRQPRSRPSSTTCSTRRTDATRAATSSRRTSPTSPPPPASSTPSSSRASSCTARASAFQAAGKSYPAGSYVVKTAQAFRPHVMDMFEPQDHPDDIPYPGGAAAAAVRRDRLDARLPDGREVRPDPRRVRRPVREASPASSPTAAGKVSAAKTVAGLPRRPRGERIVRRDQPPARRRRKRSTG